METRRAEYDGRKGRFSMENSGQPRDFANGDFWKYCEENNIIPTIMCYNAGEREIDGIRARKSQLIEAINSK